MIETKVGKASRDINIFIFTISIFYAVKTTWLIKNGNFLLFESCRTELTILIKANSTQKTKFD